MTVGENKRPRTIHGSAAILDLEPFQVHLTHPYSTLIASSMPDDVFDIGHRLCRRDQHS